MFGYPVLRSKPQRWIPELRFGYPPLRNFPKSFWEKLGIFLESLEGSQRQLWIKTRLLLEHKPISEEQFKKAVPARVANKDLPGPADADTMDMFSAAAEGRSLRNDLDGDRALVIGFLSRPIYESSLYLKAFLRASKIALTKAPLLKHDLHFHGMTIKNIFDYKCCIFKI